MPTAWAAAAKARTVADQPAIDGATAPLSVRGRRATANPSRSRRSAWVTSGRDSRRFVTLSAPGRRCAARATTTATARKPVIARPTHTADATTPRTDRTTIAPDAIATTPAVSTIRSTTTVPRIVERLIAVRSPRTWTRTSSPRRAGRTLLAR